MSALEVALDQYADRRRLAIATGKAGRNAWREVSLSNLSASWLQLLARLLIVVEGAQLAAASTADSYLAEVLAEQESAPDPAGRVLARSLTGVASDGRDLASLLLNPLVTAKEWLGKGATARRALVAGEISLDVTLRTQIADAGRVADGVAVAARSRISWTRMVVGDSCPRCIILAGRVYRYSEGFLRHPRCDCIHIPTAEDTGDDFTTDPMKAFEQGRVRGLSKADEQAIRDGADMGQVVNARRGMYTAGGRKLTREGVTRRGFAGRRLGGGVRVMPEQIYRDATSRDETIRLLKQHGYLA